MRLITRHQNDDTRVNQVHEFADVSNESGDISEPVSVEDFKNYARLQGFEEDGESGELAFNSDDDLISSLLIGARQSIEAYTGRSLVAHDWKARVTNGNGGLELPMSNSATFNGAVDCNGNAIANVVTGGIEYLHIVTALYNATVSYSTPGSCPDRLKTAILAEALFRYENRGDLATEGKMSDKALAIANTYKRVSTWLA